ncbi:MAG: GtrA family protein [Ruminococcus sp.]|nr:GtrA family protein [Ruminococcus sp.]
MLKYTAFGMLTAIVDIGTSTLCYNYLPIKHALLTTVSNVTGYVLATIFAFFTNKLFVFHSRNKGKKGFLKEFFSFFGARILSLVISMIMMLLFVDVWHWNFLVSKIVSNVFVVISNYIAAKIFIFKKKP